ncbi:MAG TPA: hypothetical protein VFW40_05440 [Capsulimonadaceae bacterium]|nr:hypothetical protein [Capsulimonadaceae bacterium]
MGRPRLSGFTVIGIVLLAIGIYGLIPGTKFTFDPGVPAEPGEAFLYIVTGILMVLNGFFAMKPLAPPPTKDTSREIPSVNEQEKAPVAPASPAVKSGDN